MKMTAQSAKRFNLKGLGLVFLFSLLGMLALATTAEASGTAPSLQSAQLKDNHHYYTLTGKLNDPNGRALHDMSILTSVAGSGKWSETPLVPEKDASGNLVWNFSVALSEKAAIDKKGLIFEFKRTAGAQTEWIKNNGVYFFIGAKSGNALLGSANVVLKQPVNDLVNGVTGSVYVKTIGFRPAVDVTITTADNKSVTVKAKRKGFVFGSKNRIIEFEFTALIPEGKDILNVTATATVNQKQYSDSLNN